MKKNFLIFTLAIVVMVMAFALPVSAATTSDGFVYSVNTSGDGEKYIKITGYTGSGGNITVPSFIDNNQVCSIEDYAFAGLTNITGITLPDGLLNIGAGAFRNCTALFSISVGESLGDLGENAFQNCTALKEIYWNAYFLFADPYSIGYFANAGTAQSGIQVTFGESVSAVPDRLFYTDNPLEAPKITSVTFGKNILSIGQSAFKNCPLTSVTFPDGLEEIWLDAFAGCDLTSVTFPAGLKYIGERAFANCADLSAVNFNDLAEIGIAKNAFLNCPQLTSVKIPKGVTFIGRYAFGYCDVSGNLEKLNLVISGYRYSPSPDYAQTNNFTFVCVGGQFSDVTAGAWYETYIDDLVAQGVFSGYSNDDENGTYSFQPESNITRAEFAVVLARASGEDLTPYEGDASFSDVDVAGWAAKSIAWAYQHGMVYGTGHGKYSPAADITREDMVVMIARFADYEKTTLTPTQAAVVFVDQSSISSYAVESVAAMQKAGIISGIIAQGQTYFNAKSSATRAQAAVMVSKLLNL